MLSCQGWGMETISLGSLKWKHLLSAYYWLWEMAGLKPPNVSVMQSKGDFLFWFRVCFLPFSMKAVFADILQSFCSVISHWKGRVGGPLQVIPFTIRPEKGGRGRGRERGSSLVEGADLEGICFPFSFLDWALLDGKDFIVILIIIIITSVV